MIHDVLAQFNARMPRSADAWADTWARHAQVVTALAARDPDEAERAMLTHFEAAETAIAASFPHAASQAWTRARIEPGEKLAGLYPPSAQTVQAWQARA